MRVVVRPSQITLWAPAKINLFLEVLERRPDGFHELETLITPVSLFDTLVCRTNPSGLLELRVSYAAGSALRPSHDPLWARATRSVPDPVPADDRNLVVQAVRLLQTELAVRDGLTMHLHKRIPTQAGLGGGSSDAAAALVAANLLWGLKLSPVDLNQAAARIGSDVPFFLAGGPAICRGRGERVQAVPARRRIPVVIVKPPMGLQTATVFSKCVIPESPISLPCPSSQAFFRVLIFNRLQSSAEGLHPRIAHIKSRFAACGVTAHQMTGSGSAYFGMLRHTRDALRVARRMRQADLGQVFLTHCMI